VRDDAVFLIDDQFAPLSARIVAAIRAITPKPVRFVLNTHWHYDHTGGNENFGTAGAVIVAHENVRKPMSSEQFIEFLRAKVPAAPRAALPLVTFPGAISFHLNGDELRAIHMPRAHTDGDAVVHFVKSDVIHRCCAWRGQHAHHSRPRPALGEGGIEGVPRHAGDGLRAHPQDDRRGPQAGGDHRVGSDRGLRRPVGQELHRPEQVRGDGRDEPPRPSMS
jgi:hypothetical protein